MPPLQPIDPVTQTATQNISSAAGNLTALEQERMRQRGENYRQGQALDQQAALADIDRSFQESMMGKQQEFAVGQAEAGRAHDTQMEGLRSTNDQAMAKLQADIHQKFIDNDRQYQSRREVAWLKYKNALHNSQVMEAEKMLPEFEALDADSDKYQQDFSRRQIGLMLANESLNSQLGEMEDATESYVRGTQAQHNQLREAISNGVVDSLTENITSPSFKEFFSGGKVDASGTMGQQLIDSFVNGPGISKALELSGRGNDPNARTALRNLLGSAVAVASGSETGRVSDLQSDAMKQALEGAKQYFDPSEIATLMSSFSDSFNSASKGFRFADLKTTMMGGKIKPKEEEQLRKVFNTFGRVGSLITPLGLTPIEKNLSNLQSAIPDAMNRLSDLSPQMVENIFAKMKPEQAAKLKAKMMNLVKTQGTITTGNKELENLVMTGTELSKRGTRLRSKLGRTVPQSEEAVTKLLDDLLQP